MSAPCTFRHKLVPGSARHNYRKLRELDIINLHWGCIPVSRGTSHWVRMTWLQFKAPEFDRACVGPIERYSWECGADPDLVPELCYGDL